MDLALILLLLKGFMINVQIAVSAIAGSIVLGTLLGMGRLSNWKIVKWPAGAFVELIRAAPLVMILFWFFLIRSEMISLRMRIIIAFTVFTSAYVAEIVRAGIIAVPKGQWEAARASGLSGAQTWIHIILPQALRHMVPALVSQFIALFKDTSLASIFGVLELTKYGLSKLSEDHTLGIPIFGTIALLFFIGAYSMSLISKRLEAK
jgi:polar amino acid transport system permease protein